MLVNSYTASLSPPFRQNPVHQYILSQTHNALINMGFCDFQSALKPSKILRVFSKSRYRKWSHDRCVEGLPPLVYCLRTDNGNTTGTLLESSLGMPVTRDSIASDSPIETNKNVTQFAMFRTRPSADMENTDCGCEQF